MTKAELRDIVKDLVEELRDFPDGYEVTSGELLADFGYEPDKMEFQDLFYIHAAMFRAAKANHITLDMSKHDGQDEGLPWNLDFVVRNKKAQIKCPHCGSRDTARILYGMPAMSEALQEKIDSGKVKLGGCCINIAENEDGMTVSLDPERYCNYCGKEFAFPTYLRNMERAVNWGDLVQSVEFQVGGFFGGITGINIKKNDKGAVVHIYFPYGGKILPADRQISSLRWKKLVNRLFNELYILEWEKEYMDPDTLDGTQWYLEIKRIDGSEWRIDGSNAYPPYWSELEALFRPFLKV